MDARRQSQADAAYDNEVKLQARAKEQLRAKGADCDCDRCAAISRNVDSYFLSYAVRTSRGWEDVTSSCSIYHVHPELKCRSRRVSAEPS